MKLSRRVQTIACHYNVTGHCCEKLDEFLDSPDIKWTDAPRLGDGAPTPGLRIHTYDKYGMHDRFKFRYCPFCGKKLRAVSPNRTDEAVENRH